MAIDTNIDPEDSDAMLEAIRQLAKAVEALESRLLILDADIDDLRSDIRNIEDKTDTK